MVKFDINEPCMVNRFNRLINILPIVDIKQLKSGNDKSIYTVWFNALSSSGRIFYNAYPKATPNYRLYPIRNISRTTIP